MIIIIIISHRCQFVRFIRNSCRMLLIVWDYGRT